LGRRRQNFTKLPARHTATDLWSRLVDSLISTRQQQLLSYKVTMTIMMKLISLFKEQTWCALKL